MSLRRPLRRSAMPDAPWASAVERYRRAVHRYHASLRMMPERALRQELTRLGGPLEVVLEDFEEAKAARLKLDPNRDAEILAAIHRAATLCAHATEAALMANEAAWRYATGDVARCLDTVQVLIKKIDELGDAARPPS